MPTAKLTDAQCRTAKPREKAYKLFDGGGLALVVLPSGAKSWRLFHRVAGKQQTTTLGLYPAVGAAEARRRAQDARQGAADGQAAPTPEPQPARPALTVKQACLDYWRGRGDTTPGYRANALRALELHVWPDLGALDVAKLTRAEVLRVLLALDAKGRHVYVRKCRLWLALPLDRCVELELCPANVVRSIDPERAFGRRAVEHHAAVPLAEVHDLLARLALEKDLQSLLALKLLALTWVRTTELRMMRKAEIEGDVWRIGRERMKMKREHLVPLSRQAKALIAQAVSRSGSSDYVFPAPHRDDRCMSENAMLYLLERVGYGGRMTGHGWRTLASTWANERGWTPDAIERQLAHAPADKVRAAYNQAQHWPERVRMLQAWADWLLPDQQATAETPRAPASPGATTMPDR
jgi:integrase